MKKKGSAHFRAVWMKTRLWFISPCFATRTLLTFPLLHSRMETRQGNQLMQEPEWVEETRKPSQYHELASPLCAVGTRGRRSRQKAMAFFTPWKLSSQKLGFFLVTFGFIWGMMLLHFTIQQRTQPESSSMLREQILDLSKRYIKALAEENRNVVDGPYAGVMTAYGKFCTAGAPPSNSALPPRDPRGSHTWSWIESTSCHSLPGDTLHTKGHLEKVKAVPFGSFWPLRHTDA